MTVLPHELMQAAVVLGIIGLILIAVGLAGLWLLVKIHRRLKETPPGQPGARPPSPPSAHDSARNG